MTANPSPPNGRASIEAAQLARLRALLAELLPANPFYSAKLLPAGISAQIAGLDEFARRAPFTTKQEIVDDQRFHPPYGSNLTYPLRRYTRFSQTSGTTGRPMRWLDTPESWSWMLDNWTEVYRSCEVTSNDRIFFAFSFGPFLGFWTAFEAAVRMGCLCIPGGGMRSAARLRAILDNGATVLCSTPTYAIRLAEAAQEEGIDLSGLRVRRIIAAGEPGASIPSTRSFIETLWRGASVVDQHGMTEIGPASYGCPNIPGVLHILESAYIAEVIDVASGRPAPPGGAGELVLTNLGRTGSPLLRYRTGDTVRRAAGIRCACGSYDLALVGGIVGRTDDMVVIRGVNIYPSAIEDIVRACGGIAEYRVEVRASSPLRELSIEIEPMLDQPDPAGLPHRLQTALNNAFGLRIPVRIVASGQLPRFDMKAQRWVRS